MNPAPLFLQGVCREMPLARMLRQVAGQMLGSPACGCWMPAPPLRFLGTSPRQIPADASFHSASFSGTDQPRVLITGWFFFSPFFRICKLILFLLLFFFLVLFLHGFVFGTAPMPPANMYSSETAFSTVGFLQDPASLKSSLCHRCQCFVSMS